MSYDHGHLTTYSFGEHDFGAASETVSFKGPAGKKGYIIDVLVSATETFTNTTTEAIVELGTTDGGAELINMGLGTLADKVPQLASDTAADIVLRDIAADDIVYLTMNAPTGGTPAGKGFVQVMINWY